MRWNVYVIERDGQHCYLSPLPDEAVFNRGLPNQAVAGEVLGDAARRATTNEAGQIEPDQFVQNPAFVQFLHASLARHAPHCPGVLEEAARQGKGWVYIVDARSSDPQGAVPPEDIIGGLQIIDGRPSGQYAGSNRYKVVGSKGLMLLDPWLERRFLQDLLRLLIQA